MPPIRDVTLFDAEQQKRFRAFQFTDADLAVLEANASFAERRLPRLLEELRDSFAPWPEVRRR